MRNGVIKIGGRSSHSGFTLSKNIDGIQAMATQVLSSRFESRLGIEPVAKKVDFDPKYFDSELKQNYVAAVDENDKETIHANPAYFGERATKEINFRALHKNATEESVFVHEAAHSLEKVIDTKAIVDKVSKKWVDEHPDDEDVKWDGKYMPAQQIAGGKISYTAISNHKETFAEAFADVYVNGKQANEISQAIVNETKKALRGKTKEIN